MGGHGVIQRYREFLPVSQDTCIISLNEGNTPLIESHNLYRHWAEVSVFLSNMRVLIPLHPSKIEG